MTHDRARVRIMAARHSAFYSPLIATMTAGFLSDEGIEAEYGVLPPAGGSHGFLERGEVDVMQSAPGSNWGPMEKGRSDLPVHFALINRRDGFFLAGRKSDPDFRWSGLEGRALLADHGGQPLLMLRYTAHLQGVDWHKIDVLDAGKVHQIDAAFRSGRGDYVHQQGPAPQQLEKEGIGHVVASVGAAMPEVAFSSLMATREFLATDQARAFMRAYRRARQWVQSTTPAAVAQKQSALFPEVDRTALASAIERYQRLGCWEGDVEISRGLYEQALEVFLYGGAIERSHPYEQVVVAPPG